MNKSEINKETRAHEETPLKERGRLAVYIADIFNVPVEEIPRPEWWKWKKEGFDIKKRLSAIDGPFVEVAGPTEKGYKIIELDELDKKVFILNITPGASDFDDQTGEFVGFYGKVDFIADARELPFKDGAIAAIFCSDLGKLYSTSVTVDQNQSGNKLNLRADALKEIFKALKPEGILVWKGGTEDDAVFARNIGFKVRQYEVSNIARLQYKEKPVLNIVFEKE